MSAQRPEELVGLRDQLPRAIRLLADPDRKAIAAYGLRHPGGSRTGQEIARPATFVVGRDRKLTYAHPAGTVLDRPSAAVALDEWARADREGAR